MSVCAVVAATAGCSAKVATDEPADGEAFDVSSGDRVELLPFRVRLGRVAAVAGVATTAPALDLMRALRIELGDHNFATGVPANQQWNSGRIATWVRALEPVCASAELRARFPTLPAGAPDLIAAAWGRPATPEDLAAIADALAPLALDDEERYVASCLSVLSALEFVAR